MKIRPAGITALLATVALGGTVALGSTASAATATACTSTNSYTHSVSAKGSVSYTWKVKNACGRNYQEWMHGWTRSYTGASTTWHEYRNELRYPCYVQTKWTHSVSKTGAQSNRVTTTSGC